MSVAEEMKKIYCFVKETSGRVGRVLRRWQLLSCVAFPMVKKKKIILLLYFYSVFSIPDEKRVLVKCFPKLLNTDLSLNHHGLSTI